MPMTLNEKYDDIQPGTVVRIRRYDNKLFVMNWPDENGNVQLRDFKEHVTLTLNNIDFRLRLLLANEVSEPNLNVPATVSRTS